MAEKKKSSKETTDAEAKEPYSMRLVNRMLANLDDEASDRNKKNTAQLIDTIFMAYFSLPTRDRIEFLMRAYYYHGKREE